MIGKMTISGMKFFAHHGCLEEERKAGNSFIVDVSYEYGISAACASDSVEDTVDCRDVCRIAAEEMAVPSNLLEHVASRIVRRVKSECPCIVRVTVSVSKVNPPGCCDADTSCVTLTL